MYITYAIYKRRYPTPNQKLHPLELKIILSLIYIFAFFFFRKIGSILTGKLKDFHTKNNPELVEKVPIIFKIFNVCFNIAAILCLVYIILIWANLVTIPIL